ncbi:1451_t:CDS:2, partial [Racocetra fulgida]
ITRRFEIKPKQVCEWLDKKQELLSIAPYTLMLNHSHQAQFSLLEKRLVEWIDGHHKEQNTALAQTNKFRDIYPDI